MKNHSVGFLHQLQASSSMECRVEEDCCMAKINIVKHSILYRDLEVIVIAFKF